MLKKITALMLAASVIIIAAAAIRSFSSSWTKRFPPKKTEPKQTETPAPIEKKNIELLPYSDTRLITSEEAAALSDQQLRIARCEITARHGKRVCSKETKKYFKSISWYHPSNNYDRASLSDIEKENVEILYKEELGRKQDAAKERLEEGKNGKDAKDLSSDYVDILTSFSYDDLSGKWISIEEDSDDTLVPKSTSVIEIREKDGIFYYVYYFVQIPICFTPEAAAEEGEASRVFCDCTTGLVTLDEDTGTITFYSGLSDEHPFFVFEYDVMSDRLIQTNDEKYQEIMVKNDDFKY